MSSPIGIEHRLSSVIFFLAALFSLPQQAVADKTSIKVDFLGRYVVPVFDEINEGVQICRKNGAESVAFEPRTHRLFVTNRTNLVAEAGQPQLATTVPSLDALDISDPSNPRLEFQIAISNFCDDGDPATTSEPTSVAVDRGTVAVAIKLLKKDEQGDDDETTPGCVAFFDSSGNFLHEVGVGSLPDMITFTPNGQYVLTADEGEANEQYTNDPEGSVSIIDIRRGLDRAVVKTADFRAFNDRREELRHVGVRIFGPPSPPGNPVDPNGATTAQDLEPEYLAVSDDSRTAYVSLQENNAVAEVDIASATVTRILPLGFKDHSASGNELDASNRDDAINITNWPVYGMYNPDALAFLHTRGESYFLTANEGDSRDKDGFSEEERVEDILLDPISFPNAAELQERENLGRLKITTERGDTSEPADGYFNELYAFGARSFSIWTTRGDLVFDSGSEFSRIISQALERNAFNTADDKTDFDDRSDDKGTEPEGITVGKIFGRWYAFTILERVGGIMVYDVTDPENASLVGYFNSRNFAQDSEVDDFFPDDYPFPKGLDENDFTKCNPGEEGPGDSAPEVILYIPKAQSPIGVALLAVAHETTSSTALYAIRPDTGELGHEIPSDRSDKEK